MARRDGAATRTKPRVEPDTAVLLLAVAVFFYATSDALWQWLKQTGNGCRDGLDDQAADKTRDSSTSFGC